MYLLAGPEIGYLLSADLYNDRRQPEALALQERQDVTGELRRVNVAATGGVSSRIRVGGQVFYVHVLYGRGIINATKPDEWGSDWKTQEIGLIVGYTL